VVDFMIKTYSRDKMTSLLLDLRDGQTIDQALQAVYGFDTDGLENAWRNSIGAKPLTGSSQPTALPTPTVVRRLYLSAPRRWQWRRLSHRTQTPRRQRPHRSPDASRVSTPTAPSGAPPNAALRRSQHG